MLSLLMLTISVAGLIVLSMQVPEQKDSFFTLIKNKIVWIFTFSYRQAKRMIIFVVGMTVLILGIVLIFFPGPALLIIPLGILILSTEFIWARRFLKKIKKMAYKNDRREQR